MQCRCACLWFNSKHFYQFYPENVRIFRFHLSFRIRIFVGSDANKQNKQTIHIFIKCIISQWGIYAENCIWDRRLFDLQRSLAPLATKQIIMYSREMKMIRKTFTTQRLEFHWQTYNHDLGRVAQKMDNDIHRTNRYPGDKCWQNKPRYPLNSDLSGGQRYPPFERPGPDHFRAQLKTALLQLRIELF